MQQLLETLTILIACAMLGNEFAVAAFVNPSLSKLPAPAYQAAGGKLAAVLGRFMPFWYGLTLLFSIICLALRWHSAHQINAAILAACVLWVMAILSSIIWLVPINNRVASDTPQSDDQKRWDLLHRWRVLLLFVASACLVAGILQER